MTTDEDDHTDEEKIPKEFRNFTCRQRRRRFYHKNQTVKRRPSRSRPIHKTVTSWKKATKTWTETPPVRAYRNTCWKTNWNNGLTTWCPQATQHTTCWQQLGSRRDPSDGAGSVVSKWECLQRSRWTSLSSATRTPRCRQPNNPTSEQTTHTTEARDHDEDRRRHTTRPLSIDRTFSITQHQQPTSRQSQQTVLERHSLPWVNQHFEPMCIPASFQVTRSLQF